LRYQTLSIQGYDPDPGKTDQMQQKDQRLQAQQYAEHF
jgi:hypothetical protein